MRVSTAVDGTIVATTYERPRGASTPEAETWKDEAPMPPNNTPSLRSIKSPPTRGFIIAAALSDGDVLGVYRDGGDMLELRWVDAQTHDQTPINLLPADLPIVAKLISDAADLLQNGGE